MQAALRRRRTRGRQQPQQRPPTQRHQAPARPARRRSLLHLLHIQKVELLQQSKPITTSESPWTTWFTNLGYTIKRA